MAIERRDVNSRAKIFKPSKSELEMRKQRENLNKSIREVEELKAELNETLNQLKKEK